MITQSFRAHLRSHIIWYVAAVLSLYFFAQTAKQLHNLFYLLVLLPTLVILSKPLLSGLYKSQVFKCLLLFSIWSLLSVIWSEQPNFDDTKDVLYVFLFIVAIAIAWQQRGKFPGRVLTALSLFTALPSLYFLLTADWSTRLVAYGIFDNPLTAANSLTFLILANIYLSTLQSKKILTGFFLLIAIIHLGSFMLCQSRSSMSALLVGTIIMLISRYPQKGQLKTLSIACLLVLIASLGYAAHKNWLVIPPGHTSDITYVIPSPHNIKSVQVTTKKRNVDATIAVAGLSSGSVKTTKNTIKLNQSSGTVTVHFTSAPILPYKYIQLTGIDADGRKVKIPITPPRIINFDASFGHRLPIWKEFFTYYLQSPIIGHGASHHLKVEVKTGDRSIFYKDTHNVYLGTALKSGIIGLVLQLLLVTLTIITLLKRSPHQPVFLGFFVSGLIATLLDDASFFDSPLPYWLLVLIPVGYAVSLQAQWKQSNES